MPSPLQQRLSTVLATALLAGGVAVVASPPASAAASGPLLYGLTSTGHLVSFRASTPGTAASDVAITGLGAGESLVGLDVRPATGDLVAVSDASKLYVLNPTTAAATSLSTIAPAFTGGAASGVDFNPVPDRLRLVGSNDQNLRVNVTTGAATTDTSLAYAAGDANAAANPAIAAAAYTNSVAGAVATRLYDIDSNLDVLVTQNPPNNGTLNTVGPLGVNADSVTGLDIDAATGTAYALIAGSLYTLNLTTGAASSVGAVAAGLVDLTTFTPRLKITSATASEGSTATVTVTRTGDTTDAATVDYATSDGTATAGSDYTAAAGTAAFAAGAASSTFAVPTTADLVTEGAETVVLTLSNPSPGTVLSPATGTLTITEPSVAYALTTDNKIGTFALSSPGTFTSTMAVTGLTAGEDLVGIDVRPATGKLYAVGSLSNLYTVDPASGAATLVAGLSTPLSGAAFGVDFNPVPDRLRIVSDTGQNLRANPDTGAVTVDSALNGAATGAVGAGYTNSFAGSAATTLFDVDAASDTLYTQNPPNNGTLVAVGALGVDVSVGSDLDVTAGNSAFGAFTVGGVPALYRVSTTTGAATSLGAFANALTEDLAIASPGRLTATTTTFGENQASATVTVTRSAGSNGPISIDYATADTGLAKSGEDFTATSGTLSFAAGQTSKAIVVPLLQDAFIEGTEAFPVGFSNPQGGTGPVATATVAIADDENGKAFGLTTGNHVVTLNPVNPAAAPSSDVAVLGLASGEDLLGLDVRPATGLLYAISSLGRIYAIDPLTGGTQLVSTSSTLPSGTTFGVDVNPVPDRLRVVSDTGQNLRINIDTGAATVDTPLAYAVGDPAAVSTPAVAGAAYTNSAVGAVSTSLYDLDAAQNSLVLQNPPNNGTLTTVGPLGLDVTSAAGLDIVSPGNSAFAVLAVAAVAPSLYRVDLTTGAASSLGVLSVPNLEDLALSAPVPAKAGRYHPLAPRRLLDTRNPSAPLVAGADRALTVTGIPANASAVVLNVTVTRPTEAGYVLAYPTGSKPAGPASNLNFARGQTIAVQVQTGLGAGGSVSLANLAGSTHVVVDLLGWYGDATDIAGLGYQALTPTRVLDTRNTASPLTAGKDRKLPVTGLAGVPLGARAVAVNVTVTGANGVIDVQLYPSGAKPARPTSTLNVVTGQTIANAAVVTVGSDGQIGLAASAGKVTVVVDIVGYYGPTASGRFVPVTPARLLDSRLGGSPRIAAGAERDVVVAGAGGVPVGAVAGVLSVTGVQALGQTVVQVLPTGSTPRTPTSSLNVVPGVVVANSVVVALGTGGATTLRVKQSATHLVVDVNGYFLAS